MRTGIVLVALLVSAVDRTFLFSGDSKPLDDDDANAVPVSLFAFNVASNVRALK